jgi:hypothetical protein
MGKDVLWVESDKLSCGMGKLAAGTTLPIVSLDGRYVQNADSYLGISRAINSDLSDAGYAPRLGSPPLGEQFGLLGRRYRGQEVVLMDDVLFSGGMVGAVKQELENRGVKVSALLCGIAVGEGKEKLEALGVETESVIEFDAVDDQICERDFTTLPGSGRKVAARPLNALYFDDRYGRPEQWASLPLGFAAGFCVASLIRNRRLSKPDVPFPAFVGYPNGTTGDVLDSAIAQRIGRRG